MRNTGIFLRYLPSLFVLTAGLLLSYSAYNFVGGSLKEQKQIEFETLSANFILKIQDKIFHETSLIDNLTVTLALAPELLQSTKLNQLSKELIHKNSSVNSLIIVDYDARQQSYRQLYQYPENKQPQLAKHVIETVDEALQNNFRDSVFPHPESPDHAEHGITLIKKITTELPQQQTRLLVAHLNLEQAFTNTLNQLLPAWLTLQLYSSQNNQYHLLYQHPEKDQYASMTNPLQQRPEHALFLPGSIDLYGQPLSALLIPEPHYFFKTSSIANFILILGVLLTLALTIYIETLRRRNTIIHQQVIERTASQDKLNQALTLSIQSHERDLDKLRASEQGMRSLVNSVDGVLWEADLSSQKVIYISQQVRRILGFEPDEVTALPGGFIDLVHGDDKKAFLEPLQELKADSHPQREFRLYDAANEIVYIRDIISPVVENDVIKGVRGVMLDVSKYKKMGQERIKMEGQLRQAQKLEAVGHLAAGIAHEINTPAQFVSDNLKFLGESFEDLKALESLCSELNTLSPDSAEFEQKRKQISRHKKAIELEFLLEDIPEALTQSLEGITRISSIVKAMKEFSHPGSDHMEFIDINHAIDNTITVARNEWRYVAEIEKDFDNELPLVECLPGEFNQVILNIIVNAAQAIAEHQQDTSAGRIAVKTALNGDCVSIHISDNGAGISNDKIERIFDPFFTTKEVGKGTGQGLAIAYSVIVDKHKGSIDVSSKLGEGSTFKLEIPLQQPAH